MAVGVGGALEATMMLPAYAARLELQQLIPPNALPEAAAAVPNALFEAAAAVHTDGAAADAGSALTPTLAWLQEQRRCSNCC